MVVPLLLTLALCADPPAVDFAGEVLPLLSDRCFTCHGPDEGSREAGLRLDVRDGALAERRGGPAVVPGDPRASRLLERVAAAADERMPPPGTRQALSADERAVLERWIAEGAPYERHWSFQPPRAAEARLSAERPPGELVDHFVAARLEALGLDAPLATADPSGRLPASRPVPFPPAPVALQARRTALALTGLPPEPERVDALEAALALEGDAAWSAFVDELLHDPAYGEHWARWWLDMARYADTKGYEADRRRTIWPWRDWVVRAFDAGMPFDRFTVEQLAGDLLPDADDDTRLATAFHRNTMTNDEGGTDDEEFRVAAVVDRVDTTMEVWMGLTASCARCHSHKFDPISQREYFQLFAVFDQTADADRMDESPLLTVSDPATRALLARQEAELAAARQALSGWLDDVVYVDPGPGDDRSLDEPRLLPWMDDELPDGAAPSDGRDESWWLEASTAADPAAPTDRGAAAGGGDGSIAAAAGGAPGRTVPSPRSGRRVWEVVADHAEHLHQRVFTGALEPQVVEPGDRLAASFWIDPDDPPATVMLQWHSSDGSWEHRVEWGEHHVPWGEPDSAAHRHLGALPAAGAWHDVLVDAADVGMEPGAAIDGWAFTQFGGRVVWDAAGLLSDRPDDPSWRHSQRAWEQRVADGRGGRLPTRVGEALGRPAEARDPGAAAELRAHYLTRVWSGRAAAGALVEREQAALAALDATRDGRPQVPVLAALPAAERRATHVHEKGNFLAPGERVEPGVPAALHAWPADQPRDRLGFARWLVSADNPLAARVLVNRVWERLFGAGLVTTSEDFGAQGERPSHPELLDALASDLVDHGWDLRHLLRRLVSSRTWRQSSVVPPAALEHDPTDRWLARAPRVRLDGETLRDQALAVAGLLDRTRFGPPVFPSQPDGIWRIVYNGDRWTESDGADRHRRSLYTFWRRTSPYPAYTTFDAPSREVCVSRRIRTNTALQALVTLNDPVFVEAAQGLARRAWVELPGDGRAQLERMLRLVLLRRPTADELDVLAALVADERGRLSASPADVQALLGDTLGPLPEGAEPVELAALTVAANVVLNLDEAVMPR